VRAEPGLRILPVAASRSVAQLDLGAAPRHEAVALPRPARALGLDRDQVPLTDQKEVDLGLLTRAIEAIEGRIQARQPLATERVSPVERFKRVLFYLDN
jgi:hypothetical protein